MRKTTRHKFMIAFAASFILSAAAVFPVFAAESDLSDNRATQSGDHFVLTGDFSDTFELFSNSDVIFDANGIGPGDTWDAVIKAKNISDSTMEFALVSIESLLDDLRLYQNLELTISVKGDIIYSGSYGETPVPISEYYSVRPGKTITFDVTVAFPELSGNEYQKAEMDSLWTFEAKHPGYSFYIPDIDEEDTDKDEEKDIIDDTEEPAPPDDEQKDNDDIIIPGTPVDPPVPPETESKDDGIKTGVEFFESNMTSMTFVFMAVLAGFIGFLLFRKARKNS